MAADAAAALPRVLTLDGIHNFRDYGGYALPGGARLKRGLLWRSAQHRDATDADLAAVQVLGLGAVIDLRGDSERADHPCRRAPGFSADVLFAGGETVGSAPHLAAAVGAIDEATAANALTQSYIGMAWRPNLAATFKLYFAALETGQPTLVHCFAGKDRTGLIVALFHHLMGVHPDDILADYMLTNSAGRAEARMAAGAEMMRARYPGIDDAAIGALMGVRPSYLAAGLDAITARHGSLAAYANDELGVTPARLDTLRALYAA